MPPQDIQSTIKDQEFLKLSPDDQVAVLKHLRESAPVKPPAKPPAKPARKGGMTAPPQLQLEGWGETYKKLGRGAVLGAASGAGIPESTSGTDVALGAIGRGLQGIGDAATSIIKDPVEGTASVLHNIASNFEASGGEAWQGWKERDPEKFAHGLGSAVTQALLLRTPEKARGAAAKSTALAHTATAIRASADEAAQLRKVLPDLAKQAGNAGIKTVGEFADAVNQAKDTINQEFNQSFAPIAQSHYIPTEISRNILNLETPDMAKTAAGREQIRQIRQAARDYQRPWTMRELNAKRMTENDNLRNFYNKDTRAQAASKLDVDISKAVRDGAADIVYDQMARNNPRLPQSYFADLKSKQGSLWSLSDHLGDANRGTGVLGDISAEQLKHEGKGFFGRVRPHLYGSMEGPHGYFSGLQEAFAGGPEKAANKGIRKAFPDASVKTIAKQSAKEALKAGGRGAWKTIPVWALANPPVRTTPFDLSPPPKLDDEE